MPLIVKGQQVDQEDKIETPVIPTNEQSNKTLRERAIVQRRNPSDPVLVVNGKEKKIGKKSQYLLDMMIIEE